MSARIKISNNSSALSVTGPDSVTLSTGSFPAAYHTSLISIFNATDGAAFICNPTDTPGINGNYIPASGSLLIGPFTREDAELQIYCEGSGNIYYSYQLIFSEK